MEEKTKRRIVIGTLVSILITISFIFFKSLSISTKSVISFPVTFFSDFVSISSSSGPAEAILSSIINPLNFIIPFIPITIALSVLVFYAVNFGEDRKLGLVSCLIPSIIGIAIVGPSVTSLFFSIGLVACGMLSTPLTVMYLEELKKWKKYRIGSRTVSKCFLLINLILFVALLINVFYEIDYYNGIYKEETKEFVWDMLSDVSLDNMPGELEILPPEGQEMVKEQYVNTTETQKEMINTGIGGLLESDTVSVAINFSIFTMPFMIFGILELLRTVVLSPLAGLITKISLSEIRT